jgi:uncharacterized protein (TIGR02145 family)
MTQGLPNTTAGQVVYLTDERNNQTYKVKKMQDGKCWIIDNLKYRGDTEPGGVGDIVLNNTSGQQNGNTSKVYNNSTLGVGATDSCKIDTTSAMPTLGTLTGCGYLYNWYAATNGSTATSGDATDSICPTSDFTLPRDGGTASDNDYAILNGAMYGDSGPVGDSDIYHRPNWVRDGAWQGLYSGGWATSLYNQGSYGLWWSSTAVSATVAYYLGFDTSNVYPANNGGKYYGRAVRCVLTPNPA